jgi:tRNA(Ile)-lysidine synthase
MAGLGPFESRPRLAVAVSGGADSMSLVLLCHRWARAKGGTAFALSIDHRLRPESASEIRRVGRWLKTRGIPHASLAWQRPDGNPKAALQARARVARYELLGQWCRGRGVLHLALAHHAGDQAETVLMRLARGGGSDGLAGMSAIAARQGVRLIRPLLGIEPARLRATLEAEGQNWIEDPSNANLLFERVRWRRLIPAASVAALASAAREIGHERARRETMLNDLLAGVHLDPAGFAALPLAALMEVPADAAERALARCLIVIGAETYAPSQPSLARLRDSLAAGATARTLGGCRLVCREGRLFVFREPAAAGQHLRVRRGQAVIWDNRFELVARAAGEIAPLGESGWACLPADERPRSMPRDAALALPALWRSGQGIGRPWQLYGPGLPWPCRFRPRQPLAPAAFAPAALIRGGAFRPPAALQLPN